MIKIDHMISLTIYILLIFYVIHTTVQLTYPFERTTQAELAIYTQNPSKHFSYTALGGPVYYFDEGTVVIPADQTLKVYGFIRELLMDNETGRQVYWANDAYSTQLHRGVFLLDVDAWEDVQRLRGEYKVTAYRSAGSFYVEDVRVMEYAPEIAINGSSGDVSSALGDMGIPYHENVKDINLDHDFLIMTCDSTMDQTQLKDFVSNGSGVFAIDNASVLLNTSLELGFEITDNATEGSVNITMGGWYLNQTAGDLHAYRHYYDNITNASVPLATWSGNSTCYTYAPYKKGYAYLFLPHMNASDGVKRVLGNAIFYSASRPPDISYNGYHSYDSEQWVIPLNDQDNISGAYALAYRLLNNSTTVHWTMIGSSYPTVDGKYPAHMGAFIIGRDISEDAEKTNVSFKRCNDFFTKNVWTANSTPEIAIYNNGDKKNISDILNETGFNYTYSALNIGYLKQYDILILPNSTALQPDSNVVEFAKRGGIVLAVGQSAKSIANSPLFGPVNSTYFNETKAMYADHNNITDPSTQFYSGYVTEGYVLKDWDFNCDNSLTVLGSWDRGSGSNITFARGKHGWKRNIYLFFPYDFNGETKRIIPDLAFMSVFNSDRTDRIREHGAPALANPVVHRKFSSIGMPCNDVEVRFPVMIEVAS